MPTFAPNGSVYIGAVPWDGSYRNVRRFRTRQEQHDAIRGYCNARMDDESYTYIRKDSAIRVECNAEWGYRQNYLMYMNRDSGNKWYYCFIESVNYVNDNCTEFVISTDVMQTYQFDWELRRCFVERAHVSDDRPGKHVNPEPAVSMLYGYDEVRLRTPGVLKEDYFDEWYCVIETTAQPKAAVASDGYPDSESDELNKYGNGLIETSGGYYERLFTGCKRFGFLPQETVAAHPSGTETNAIREFLRQLAMCGGGEAVVDCYMFPRYFAPERGSLEDVFEESPFESFAFKRNQFKPQPQSLYASYVAPPLKTHGGYVPRNKKLLCFPYSYFELVDGRAQETAWKWEQWTRVETALAPEEGDEWGSTRNLCKFRWGVPFDSTVTAMFVPCKYEGMEENVKAMTAFNLKCMVTWNYSAYHNWMAQESSILKQGYTAIRNEQRLASARSGMDIVWSMLSHPLNQIEAAGSGAVYGAQGGGAAGAAFGALGGVVGTIGEPVRAAAGVVSSGFDILSQHSQASVSRLALQAQIDRAAKNPPVHKGSESSAALYNTDLNRVRAYRVSLLPEFARLMDDFFDRFGYQVDVVDVPRTTGRPCWNYVRTRECDVKLAAPNDDIDKVNAIFDSGVTFWHVDDVGNYALDNGIGGNWDYDVVPDDEEVE